MTKIVLSLLVLAVATPLAARAQSAPAPLPSASPAPAAPICASGIGAIVTRPTQTTSTCTVEPNHVLIETGFQTESVIGGAGNFTYTSVPNSEVRIGTALRNVEVDIFAPTAYRAEGAGATSDIGAGIKVVFGQTPTFAWGANVNATAPTGTNPYLNPAGLGSAVGSTQTYNLNAQGSLGPVFGYGATLSEVSNAVPISATAAQRYQQFVPSLDLTAALPASFTLFVEGFSQSNGEGPGTGSHVWFDGGVEKDIGRTQLDLEYGTSNGVVPAPGLPAVHRHYAGFGFSYYL